MKRVKMPNLLITNNGTPWNTLKKISVPAKSALLLLFKGYMSMSGTLEHWNTICDKSRIRFSQFLFLSFWISLNLNLLNHVFQCSGVPAIDCQRLNGVPVGVLKVFWPVFRGEKWT